METHCFPQGSPRGQGMAARLRHPPRSRKRFPASSTQARSPGKARLCLSCHSWGNTRDSAAGGGNTPERGRAIWRPLLLFEDTVQCGGVVMDRRGDIAVRFIRMEGDVHIGTPETQVRVDTPLLREFGCLVQKIPRGLVILKLETTLEAGGSLALLPRLNHEPCLLEFGNVQKYARSAPVGFEGTPRDTSHASISRAWWRSSSSNAAKKSPWSPSPMRRENWTASA